MSCHGVVLCRLGCHLKRNPYKYLEFPPKIPIKLGVIGVTSKTTELQSLLTCYSKLYVRTVSTYL